MKIPDEIYIMVSEHDGSNNNTPLAWETHLDERCSIKSAVNQCIESRGSYGETRIGRLILVEGYYLIERYKLLNDLETDDLYRLDKRL